MSINGCPFRGLVYVDHNGWVELVDMETIYCHKDDQHRTSVECQVCWERHAALEVVLDD